MKLLQLLLLSVFLVTACDPRAGSKTDDTSAPSPKPAGIQCFTMSSKTADITVLLNTAEDGSVTGMQSGTVHDEENAYYTSYQSRITGAWSGDTLNANLVTVIEYDVQESEELWVLKGDTLIMGQGNLVKSECGEFTSEEWDTRLKLHGKWQSVDDPKSFVRIRETQWIDEYEGMPDATSQTQMMVLDECGGNPAPNGAYISTDDERCFSINVLTETDLELTYMARGNTLKYKKVKE